MRTLLVVPIIGVLTACGCGSSAPTSEIVSTVPGEGVLLYNGQPLTYHQVTVMPAGEGARPAVGITDAEGRFVLGTNDVGDGAMPGTHPVAVSYVGPPSNDPNEGMTVFTEPPPPDVEIPAKYKNPETSGLTLEIPEDGTSELRLELK